MTYEIHLKSGKSFTCSPSNLNIDKHAIEMYDKDGTVIAFISLDSIEALTVVDAEMPDKPKAPKSRNLKEGEIPNE